MPQSGVERRLLAADASKRVHEIEDIQGEIVADHRRRNRFQRQGQSHG